MTVAQVNVSVADDYLDRLPQVAQELRAAGFHVERDLSSLGVLTGYIDSAKLASLDRIQGVEAVQREREFQIAPPDSPVQ